MNRALGEIPLTLKIRTGVKDGRNTAHKLMPRLGKEWGVGAITVRIIPKLFSYCRDGFGGYLDPWKVKATKIHKVG